MYFRYMTNWYKFFLFLNFTLLAQNTKQLVGVDIYGYSYFIENNVFSKSLNNEKFEYKNISLGKISKVDIQNPLKIILFFQDFNSVITLDNQLNETEKIKFSQIDSTMIAQAVSLAANNSLWVFNGANLQLYLYNFIKKTFIKIGNPFLFSIKHYDSNFNHFFWIDSQNELHNCSLFGQISHWGKLPTFDNVYIENEKNIVFYTSNTISVYDAVEAKEKFFKVTETLIKNVTLKNQNLSIFTAQEIHQIKLK